LLFKKIFLLFKAVFDCFSESVKVYFLFRRNWMRGVVRSCLSLQN